MLLLIVRASQQLGITSPITKHISYKVLRICGFSPGWWKEGPWYLLCEGGTADCSVLVTVYTYEVTKHDSQYNTLQPPRLVPLLTRLSMVVILLEGPCSNIKNQISIVTAPHPTLLQHVYPLCYSAPVSPSKAPPTSHSNSSLCPSSHYHHQAS
jgi:hypothetical protein